MSVQIISNGDLSRGGAVVETSGGVKLAILYESTTDGIEIWTNLDTSPFRRAINGGTTIHGSAGECGFVHAAIDSNDDIHIVSAHAGTGGTQDIAYAIATAPLYAIGSWEEVVDYSGTSPVVPGVSISLDSSDKPHVLFIDYVAWMGTSNDNVYYTEKTGASWAAVDKIGDRVDKTHSYDSPTITLRNSDYIEAFYYFNAGAGDPAYKAETGSGWPSESTYAETSATIGFGGVISTTGGTVYRYHADDAEDIEENDVDTTYNADATGNRISASMADDSDRYIFYLDSGDDVHLISNDGGGWTDEGDLQTGTYNYVIAGWSYNNLNNSTSIDYLFSDGANVYWDEFGLVDGAVRRIFITHV